MSSRSSLLSRRVRNEAMRNHLVARLSDPNKQASTHAKARKEKPPTRILVLATMFLAFGAFSGFIGVLSVYTSNHMDEAWVSACWESLARSGMMPFPQAYATLDFVVGIVYVVCGCFILRVKHMEFAAITALATGLVALFVYGIGDWRAYVSYVRYEGLSATYLRVAVQGALPMVVSALSLTVQREEAKTLLGKRIRGFWIDFSHNKIGLVGAAILLTYIAAAVLVPVLSLGIKPETSKLADDLVPPEWLTVFFPSANGLPRTSDYASNWSKADLSMVPEYIRTNPGFTWTIENGSFILNISDVMVSETVPFCVTLESTPFSYAYDAPRALGFTISFDVKTDPHLYRTAYNDRNQSYLISSDSSKYNVEINFTTPATTLSIWDSEWDTRRLQYYIKNFGPTPELINLPPAGQRLIADRQTGQIILAADIYWSYRMNRLHPGGGGGVDALGLSKDLFGQRGNYTFRAHFFVAPYATNPPRSMHFYAKLTPVKIHIDGLLWGFMGTDHLGRDVWSRVVHGIKISLAIGLLSAVASSFFGVLVGVVAGYLGGAIDELLMRSVDVLLALPVIPLLMILVSKFGNNIWYIVLLIAIFGWQPLSRTIRSQVLSLRESSFVECATASGASRTYIMVRHLVPNVLPLILSDFVLSVPGAIMAEAGLSFVGFGDPTTLTWGSEFRTMWVEGGGFSVVAWWWIIPPTAAITLLCLAFVFLGNALDEIVNPRLRRRR